MPRREVRAAKTVVSCFLTERYRPTFRCLSVSNGTVSSGVGAASPALRATGEGTSVVAVTVTNPIHTLLKRIAVDSRRSAEGDTCRRGRRPVPNSPGNTASERRQGG